MTDKGTYFIHEYTQYMEEYGKHYVRSENVISQH